MNGERELASRVYAASDEAFLLAKRVAAGEDAGPLAEAAEALDARLRELAPATEEALDRGLARAVSEGAADTAYVLAGGRAPTSLRLAQVRRDLGAADAGEEDAGPPPAW